MVNDETPRNAAEIVSATWSAVLACRLDTIDPAVPAAAYAHQPLRQLYPMVSHGVLYPSRCTRWPWTRDVGTACPLVGGGYRVRRESDRTLLGEVGTLDEAYALIAARLPAGCGPAVDGTPDDLQPRAPAEGFGRLLPDAALSVATGGASGAPTPSTRLPRAAVHLQRASY